MILHRGKLDSLDGAEGTYEGSAGIDDEMISKNFAVMNSTVSLFCRSSSLDTLAESSSYPCPAGMEVTLFTRGTINDLR